MSKPKRKAAVKKPDILFARVVSILEKARSNVVRAVNTNMVLAYWLIGREIVQELQGGKARAKYGERVVEDLSARLTARYGKGFSLRNVKLFRQFYLIWQTLPSIGQPEIAQLADGEIGQPMDVALAPSEMPQPMTQLPMFSPQLTWTHYIALMRVDNLDALPR